MVAMKRVVRSMWFALALLSGVVQAQQLIVPGPTDDVRVSVVAPEGPTGKRLLVFDRFVAQPPGATLWLTEAVSADGDWTVPRQLELLGGARAMPSLLSSGTGWTLIHAWAASVNATLIQRATADAELDFTDVSSVLTGWPAGTRYIQPSVTRGTGGELLLAYRVLHLDEAFVARSIDDGQTWDTALVQASDGPAQLPRLTRRPTDGLTVLTFHRERMSGGSDIYVRISSDPLHWTAPELPLTTEADNQMAFPVVLSDGTLVTVWSRTGDGAEAQLWASWSSDGEAWSEPAPLPVTGTGTDTQPVALPTSAGGRIELYWARGLEGDRDIYRQDQVLVVDPLWADGFE